MLLLFLLLTGSIVASDTVRVLAVASLSVRVSLYIAVLEQEPERKILRINEDGVMHLAKRDSFEKRTIFLRFFVLAGFPSLSFFFASFFFLGRPFFLHGTSLSDSSASSTGEVKGA